MIWAAIFLGLVIILLGVFYDKERKQRIKLERTIEQIKNPMLSHDPEGQDYVKGSASTFESKGIGFFIKAPYLFKPFFLGDITEQKALEFKSAFNKAENYKP